MPVGEPPLVSVVLPTCRRPDLLRRAVESVRAQTLADWELIVSDDEPATGAAWAYLESVARDEPRLRIVRNTGPHGQIGNSNHALRHARGRWVKPLHDDDALRPGCLETMLAAAERVPGVALVRCRAASWDHGVRRRPRRGPAGWRLLPGERALLAMYLQDVELGTPGQLLARRRAIDCGAMLRPIDGVVAAVDWWWCVELLRHGSLLLLPDMLLDIHQGAHQSVTSELDDDRRFAELARLRGLLAHELAAGGRPPALAGVLGMDALIRAAGEAWRWRLGSASRRAARVRSLAAWTHFARWAARRASGDRLTRLPREIPAAAEEVAAGSARSREAILDA